MQNNKIGLFHAYGAFWKYYADFAKRTSKEAFWKAWVIHSAIMLTLSLPIYYAYQSIIERGDMSANIWLVPLSSYSIATIIPVIALIVRRLHDIDRNGCWFFLYLIPFAGPIFFFIMLVRTSAPYNVYPGLSGSGPYTDLQGRNNYGMPQNPFGQSQYPYVWPQNPYAPPPPGQQQNHYAVPPYGQQKNPYAPPPYGQQQNHYAVPPPGRQQNHYAVPPYGWQQNHYAVPPPGWQQNPYATPPHGQQGNPYAPSYGKQQNQYASPPYVRQQNQSGPSLDGQSQNPDTKQCTQSYTEPLNPYVPPPVELSKNPDTLPYTQDNIRLQNPYAPPPYGQVQDPSTQPYFQGNAGSKDTYAPPPYGQAQGLHIPPPYGQAQNPYAGFYYSQQMYGPYVPPPWYRKPIPQPRLYAPPSGGGNAIVAFIISIVLAVAYFGNSTAVSVLLTDNMDRYLEAVFGDMLSEYDYIYPYDNYGWNDGDGNWDGRDYYGRGDDMAADNGLTDEEQAAVDLVRDGVLPGFPEFTIEEVLLAQVDEDDLLWNFSEGYEDYSNYYITAAGYVEGTFYYLYAAFDVFEDGTIELYSLSDGIRDEYKEDAVGLYKEWYDRMLSDNSNASVA